MTMRGAHNNVRPYRNRPKSHFGMQRGTNYTSKMPDRAMASREQIQ
jgi:hypothetical protein